MFWEKTRAIVIVYLWFAFLATVSYGGNLRAFLLRPEVPEPINSVDHMGLSGKEWKMVVYNDQLEHTIAERVPQLWDPKVPVGYNDFPFEIVRFFFKVFLCQYLIVKEKNINTLAEGGLQ